MRPGLLLLAVLFLASTGFPQTACPPLSPPPVPPGANIFSGAQEMELGEIVRQQAEQDFLVIDEEALTGYLKTVGARVARQLPDTGLHYEFVLYDRPEIQAFGMPGGRVYVSRKMVAFLRNEDELAGLLGHELGHMASRQQAIGLSQMFRDVLGIRTLANNEDLFERYNDLVDRARLKSLHGRNDPEKGQEVADLLGVQAVARAGYAPQAFPDFLDRLMETKGSTGSWLSDLFSMTRPSSKRLRLALRDVTNLPKSCIEKDPPSRDLDKFHEWQGVVLHYNGIGHAEHLPNSVTRVTLNDPLRGDIETFRFSSDGKYLLAQDDGGIYVILREPLQYMFRIDAPDAGPAQFSPDAHHVVFFNHSQRVVTWDVQNREQVSLDDVPAIHGCRDTALSADARYLACFAYNFSLVLYEVPSGETLLQVDRFFDMGGTDALHQFYFELFSALVHGKLVTLRFSPDGRYFAASSRSDQGVLFDLIARRKLNVSGPLFKAMQYAFTFVGQDHIVGVNRDHPEKSPLIELPSQKVVDQMPLGGDTLFPATSAQFIFAGPIKDHPLGAYDLNQKKIVFGNRSTAADIWNGIAVSERLNGELGLYKVGEARPSAVLTPPLGKLGTLRAVAISPDLKWLAMSGRTRGGEWNIEKNARIMLTRSFQRVAYAEDSSLLVDFPSFEKIDRELVLVDPGMREPRRRIAVNDKDHIDLFGNIYVRTKSRDDKPSLQNLLMEALDTTSDRQLWSHSFPKQSPEVFLTSAAQRLVFLWHGKTEGLPPEMARNTELAKRWKSVNSGDGDIFAEVVNAQDGAPTGGLVVHTGKYSFRPEYVTSAGDALALADNRNRCLLYSLDSGQRKASWFGARPRLSRDGQRLCLVAGPGRLAVYDLRSLKLTAEFSFAAPVVAHTFSADGSKLLALTNDQTVFVLDATATNLN